MLRRDDERVLALVIVVLSLFFAEEKEGDLTFAI
jgi:hypothetical protein